VQISQSGHLLTLISRLRRSRTVQTGVTILLVALGPLLAGATYTALGPLDQGSNSPLLRLVVLADISYILVLVAIVILRIAQMIGARRAQSAGSRLHLRLTGVFGLLALLPTIMVAVFAVLSINVGLEGWFSSRVGNVLANSLSAAQAYEEEHRQELERDGFSLAAKLNSEREANFFMSDGEIRQTLGRLQTEIERGLIEAFVLDSSGEIRARGARSYEFGYEKIGPDEITSALENGILVIEDWNNNEFRALIPLTSFTDRFLYVTRSVDGNILNLLDQTQETVSLYKQLESDRGRLLFEFGILYLGFAVILILAAVLLGLWFAERLSRPVGQLVLASQKVGAGDLNVRVPEEQGDDEIAQLGTYFNQMTERLKVQRDELVENTQQVERRRRLFDSVLGSITSGVVGLNAEGQVAFVNRSARRLLDVTNELESRHLSVAVPEFGPLLDALRNDGREVVQEQVNIVRSGTQEALLVRMSTRRGEDETPEGYVVAFDDVTDLVSAQRLAAWGDVARRIAHEIKNPLTPIQLSAERIKRKFAAKLGDEGDDLRQMTEVIVRQTNDLRRIVDEFSRFARMPEPDRITNDLAVLLRDAVTLQKAGQPGVRFVTDIPEASVLVEVDATMIGQALTNIIKNAGEAIETYREKNEGLEVSPEIRIRLALLGNHARITVADNGIGLPEDRARLFEPYVTTRAKGTGLGLPIVKKIVEEHGGSLSLVDAEPFDGASRFGAMAVIDLPLLAHGAAAQNVPE
jgi:two-component system nitrogen regulation sensor histidine kinase NtrY